MGDAGGCYEGGRRQGRVWRGWVRGREGGRGGNDGQFLGLRDIISSK